MESNSIAAGDNLHQKQVQQHPLVQPSSPMPLATIQAAPSTSSPYQPIFSLVANGNPAGNEDGFETPLRKALHAAAALASVTAVRSFPLPASSSCRSAEIASLAQLPNATIPQVSRLHPPPPTPHLGQANPAAANPIQPRNLPSLQQQLPQRGLNLLRTVTGAGPSPTTVHSTHLDRGPSLLIQLPPIGVARPPGTYHQMAAAIKASERPAIFRDQQQRSGKWTREEETYADLLIELFEKGHIDERNGTTLRSFLARKLHCAPMRISKKYAGKGIGKMVFLSKNNFRGMDDGIGSPAYHSNMQRLRQAELLFYKICFPELSMQLQQSPASSTGTVAQHQIRHAPPESHVPHAMPHLVAGKAQVAHATLVGVPLHAGQKPVAMHTHVAVPPGTVSHSLVGVPAYWLPAPPAPRASLPGAPVAAMYTTPLVGTPAPMAPLPTSLLPPPSSVHNSLEQACLNVKKSVQHGTRVATTVASIADDAVHNKEASQHAHTLQQIYGSAATSNLRTNITQNAYQQISSHGPAREHDTATFKAPVAKNETTSRSVALCDMPDFLSGFDMVAGLTTTNETAICNTLKPLATGSAATDPAQYSPTFTSKSFDDLHRFLGTNLPPLGQAGPNYETVAWQAPGGTAAFLDQGAPPVSVAKASTSVLPRMPAASSIPWQMANTTPITTAAVPVVQSHQHNNYSMLSEAYSEALSTATQLEAGGASAEHSVADSYNIFAQQSAFAASQHSAYIGSHGYESSERRWELSGISGIQKVYPARRYPASVSAGHKTTLAPMSNRALRAVHNPNVVSEPSNASSEHGTEESDNSPGDPSAGSGTYDLARSDCTSSNDSDGTNSEASSRKKARITFHHRHPWHDISATELP